MDSGILGQGTGWKNQNTASRILNPTAAWKFSSTAGLLVDTIGDTFIYQEIMVLII